MMFLRGDIWRAVAINRLQAPTLLSLRDSRPAKTKASVYDFVPSLHRACPLSGKLVYIYNDINYVIMCLFFNDLYLYLEQVVI